MQAGERQLRRLQRGAGKPPSTCEGTDVLGDALLKVRIHYSANDCLEYVLITLVMVVTKYLIEAAEEKKG